MLINTAFFILPPTIKVLFFPDVSIGLTFFTSRFFIIFMRTNTDKELATNGEILAADFLSRSGYEILASNYFNTYGEIDIVALDRHEIVIIEVKTRTRHDYKSVENCITFSKRKKLTLSAQDFLAHHQQYSNLSVRFDLIAVLFYPIDQTFKIRHYKDAFKPVLSSE